ncbi:MAG: thioredoxin family protein [Bacteroidia bacterium]|nr:thioredoxin family protein [Bacteroidia bacterium]
MKQTIFLLSLLLVFACRSNGDTQDSSEETTLEIETNSELNVLVPDEEDGGEMLLGKINRKGLETELFREWFDENYKAHVLDTVTVDSLIELQNDLTIKVFMGTWCEDSQREVPALFKILDAMQFEEKNLEMIAVSHDKDTPQGYENDLKIEYVPTIILSKPGIETNRIVEYPQQTLEKDLLQILKGKPYKHAYQD